MPDACKNAFNENPSNVIARVQSIIHVNGFHSAICPYHPSISSTGKKAELIKMNTKIIGNSELTTSWDPVLNAMAIRKLPTPIDRKEVIKTRAKALLTPPDNSAPKAKKIAMRIVA